MSGSQCESNNGLKLGSFDEGVIYKVEVRENTGHFSIIVLVTMKLLLSWSQRLWRGLMDGTQNEGREQRRILRNDVNVDLRIQSIRPSDKS